MPPLDFWLTLKVELGVPLMPEILVRRAAWSAQRTNLVLTRDLAWYAAGVDAVHSLEEALARSGVHTELVAIGGAEVYRLVLPLARRIYLTHVHADVPGDAFFPDFDSTQWADVECSAHPADENHAYPFTFVTLERRYAPEAPRHH